MGEKIELREMLRDDRVVVFQDELNHIHLYYNGFYRAVIGKGFWREAELSLFETDDFLEVRSAGQGIMRFPLAHDLPEEDEWPDVVNEREM
jgi:hypothetical protein